MKKYWFLFLLLTGSLACATITGGSTPNEAPTSISVPTEIPAVATVESAPTEVNRNLTSDIYCSSDIPEAVDAYNQGVEFDTAGNIDSAIESYKAAIELDPEYCDAMDNLALVLRKTGNYEEAAAWYEKSVEVAPDNSVAHMGLANTYFDLERYDEALTQYNELLRINPEDPEGHYGAGRVHFSLEEYTDAIDRLKQAEELYKEQNSPYISDAQLLIGISYVMLEEYEQGRDYLEMAYPQMPDNSYLNYYLGYAYYYGDTIRDEALAKQYLLRARDLGIELEPTLENFVNTP